MTKYRKSWTDALKEIRSNVPDKIEKDETDVDYHYGHEPQGLDDQYIEHLDESAALQLKMAFSDAKIEIKGVKGGKLVISKKDKKKVEKVIAKQMKKPEDAKRVLGSQIVFEEILNEKGTAYPATVDTLKMIVKDKQHQTVMFDKGSAKVDLFTASAMIAVYKALKQPQLKKKFEDMIKSKEGFMQTQAFAMKVTK